MKTLDRYIIRSFLWSTLLLLVAMLALRITVDLFLNMDEFMEDKTSFLETLRHISTYYAYQTLIYLVELGGSVILVAASFTMARMNHTNELTAMLASGVSLHRVILPMVVTAMLLNGLLIVDREVVVPANAQHLLRSHDEAREVKTFPIYLAPDGDGAVWWSTRYDPTTKVMESPTVAVRDDGQPVATLRGQDGSCTLAKLKLPGRKSLPGWEFQNTALSREVGTPWSNIPTTRKIYTHVGPQALLDAAKRRAAALGIRVPPDRDIPTVNGLPPVEDAAYAMTVHTRCPANKANLWQLTLAEYRPGKPRGGTLADPVFTYRTPVDPNNPRAPRRVLGIFHATEATWVPAKGGDQPEASHWLLTEGRLFFPSDLTNRDLTLRQSSRWLDFMSLSKISELLEGGKVPDRQEAVLAKHARVAEPINNIILLLLGLPFILSRERNIKASAGLAVLMTGTYFAFIHAVRLVGLPPMLAAFLPIVLFGAVAAVMMDSIKT